MNGRRRGRPARISPAVREKAVRMYLARMSTSAIAQEFNHEGISTPMGTCKWTRMHVWRLLRTRDAVELLDQLENVRPD